jgi:hypothetical protein
MTASILRISLSAALASLAASVSFAAATVPMGAMVYTISAGTPLAPVVTTFSVPLRDSVPLNFVGTSAGLIASAVAGPVTNSEAITVTGAAWDPLQFRVAAQPYFLRVMTGAAAGRNLLILPAQTGHTASSVIVDNQGVPVAASLAGAKFEIYPADTIKTFFAGLVSAGSVVSGATASVADVVQIHNGSTYVSYFYNGTNWRRSSPPGVADDIVIRPDAAVIYSRKGALVSFTVLGTVPSTDVKVVVRDGQTTVIGGPFPVNQNIPAFSFNTLPGWVSTASGATSDKVLVHNGTSYQTFFFNNTEWRRVSPPGSATLVSVAAGRP